MALKKADTLDDQQFKKMLQEVVKTVRRPNVEMVVFLMSYKAGLRSQEIAGLEWDRHLLDVDGNIKHQEFKTAGARGRMKREEHPVLWISEDIGKYGSERTLRIHPVLFKALLTLRAENHPGRFVIPSGKRGASEDLGCRAHALTFRINRYYKKMGLDKCTTHSGRRTFITKAARTATFAGCSLVDVQDMAGHRQLTTTQEYIDTTAQQADLIGML